MSERGDLAPYIGRIPQLASATDLQISRLGGLTNLNYRVDAGTERFALRVPGAGTAEYIDRVAEEAAARSAADAGVNADVVFFDASDGLMMTRLVDNAVTMNAELFRDMGAVARAGTGFRRLHETARPFATGFQLFPMLDEYKALLAAKHASLPDGYDDVHVQAHRARSVLEAHPVPLRPCHCDPLCENFLDTGDRMYIIDYEYSANNDPMWDLGDLSVEGGFDDEQDQVLLRAYFGGEPPREQVARMVIHKAMCDLLWTLWGVIQHVNRNPVDDFWAYAVGRFERCRALLATAEFAEHVAALAKEK